MYFVLVSLASGRVPGTQFAKYMREWASWLPPNYRYNWLCDEKKHSWWSHAWELIWEQSLVMLRYSAWLSGRARGTQTTWLYVWRGGVRETQTQEVRNPSSGLALPWSHCVSRHRALSLLGPAFIKGGPGWGLVTGHGVCYNHQWDDMGTCFDKTKVLNARVSSWNQASSPSAISSQEPDYTFQGTGSFQADFFFWSK